MSFKERGLTIEVGITREVEAVVSDNKTDFPTWPDVTIVCLSRCQRLFLYQLWVLG